MNDTESKLRARLNGVAECLPAIVNQLSARHGKPSFVEDGVDSRFLYGNPTWITYQLVKSVRLVSALRGALILNQWGHTVEAGATLRLVSDFMGDICFAQDAIQNGKNNAEQTREFKQFFEDFKDHPKQQYEGAFRMNRGERKKVQAALGRYLDKENPHEPRKLAKALDHVFSGYVHGSYSTIMEMYAGGRDEFDMQGMAGSPRVEESLQAIAYYLEMSVAVLIQVAINLHDRDAVDRLRELKDGFRSR